MNDLVKRLKDAVLPIQVVWPLRLEAAKYIEEYLAKTKDLQKQNNLKGVALIEKDERIEELEAKLETVRKLVDKSRREDGWSVLIDDVLTSLDDALTALDDDDET